MRYRIRFRRRAKEELSRAKQYSSQFSHDLDEWLSDIASSVENRSSTQSIDVVDILEKGINASGNPGPWTAAWAKWWQATPIDKVRAVIAFLKTKSPPWELRATAKWFTGILGAFDCEVHAYFEVNHVDGEVIFTQFTGLPGEDN